MGLSKQEQEVVISKCADESHFTVYSTDPKWTKFFTELCEAVGGRVFEHQGGTKFQINEADLRIGKKRKLNLSDAQRAELSARGKRTMATINQKPATKEDD